MCLQPAGSFLSRLSPSLDGHKAILIIYLFVPFSSLNKNQHPLKGPFTFQNRPSALSCFSHSISIDLALSCLSIPSSLFPALWILNRASSKTSFGNPNAHNDSCQRALPLPTHDSDPPCWQLMCPQEGKGMGLAPRSHLRSRSYCRAVAHGPNYRETTHTRNSLQLSWRNVVSAQEMNLINVFSYYDSHPASPTFSAIRHIFSTHWSWVS